MRGFVMNVDQNSLAYYMFFFSRDRTEKKCRTIHKQVPTQITGKVAFRECPGKASYEYTPTEVREMDFTGY